MNKSYKSIWNESLGTYVAASEVAHSGGRKVSSARKSRRAPERALSSQIVLEQRIVFDAALPATVVETTADKQTTQELLVADDQTAVHSETTQTSTVVVPAVTVATDPASETKTGSTSGTTSTDTSSQSTTQVSTSSTSWSGSSVVSDSSTDTSTTATPVAVATTSDTSASSSTTLPADKVVTQEADASVVATQTSEPERVEIVFVDSVAADIVDDLDWHPGEIHVLDANRDGVEQIAEILAGRTGVDAIHIISHGSDGQLELGNAVLDSTSLAGEHADELAVIRASLSADADLLIYGCEVSQTAKGQAFVNALADATGADVASSDDNTGSATLGGDWVLETRAGDGTVETTVITAAEWAGVLTTPVNVGQGAFLGSSGMGIYSIDVTTGKATLLTTVPTTITYGGNTVTLVAGDGLNSLAVDQANHLIYYVSNTSSNTNVALLAYDWVANEHIIVDNNLTTGLATNVVVGLRGVGSGSATFHSFGGNNYLYLGVEENSGGDGGGTVSDDTIYRLTLSADGKTVSAISTLAINITNNDWGDLGYDAATNSLQSSSLNGTTVNVTRYTLNAAGTAVASTAAITVNTTNTQAAESSSGNTYLASTAIQQYDPTTGALIGSAITITTNGTTALGALNDAASWTPPAATIGDKVFTDANNNGTFDGADTGIAGVTVRLVDDVNNNGVADAGERVLATDTTDASGNYLFTGVLPGNYVVQVTDTGGVLGTGRTYTTTGGNTRGDADVTQIGSANLNLDFGLNNRPPVNVVPGTQTVPEDGNLTITGVSASDPDGNLATTQLTVTNGILSVSLAGGATISAGANGTSTLTLSGTAAQINAALASIGYQPTANYFGSSVLTVRSTDVAGLTDTDTVNITVAAVNDPPVDGNETNTVTEDTTLTVANGATGDLLNNSTDVDGGTPVITQFVVNGTTYTAGNAATIAGVGTLTINGDGSYSFAPATNYNGPIPVATYTVSDGAGGTDTSTLTLSITPVNDAPVDGNETNTVTEDTTLTVADGGTGDLLNNASDVDGDTLSITQFVVNGTTYTAGNAATIAGVGTLTINGNGSYSFAPAANYNGPI
ncbi:MAG: DUF4347 domain-containing protein, partial [Hydrogenophaga sp.]|nr:DUF4347 domain-containing protein [Hydrogenophaga sp.]